MGDIHIRGPNFGSGHSESPAHPFDVDTENDIRCKGSLHLPQEMLDVEDHEEVVICTRTRQPSELTTAYLPARPQNRFVRVSDKITAVAYR